MNKQEIFGSHIKRMHIKTIPMIGNPYTSSLIGLDEGGISFLERAGCRYRAYCTHHSTASLDPLCEVYLAHFDQVFSNIAQSIFQEERGERHAV